MRSRVRARLRFGLWRWCGVAACLLAATLLRAVAVAQAPAAANSTDTANLLIQAAKSYGLNHPGMQPWRLRVTFQLLDAQGNTTDQGTYEELWGAQFKYKRTYTSTAFTQTQYASPEHGVQFSGVRNAMPPQSLYWVRAAFVSPMVSETMLERTLAGTAPGITIVTESNEAGVAGLACYGLRSAQQPAGWKPLASYCFDASNSLATFTVGFPRMGDATLENPFNFDGHLLPSNVLIKQNGVPVLKAHLESITQLSEADEAEMQSPPGAALWSLPVVPQHNISARYGTPPPGPPSSGGTAGHDSQGNPIAPMPKKINISAGVAAGLLLQKVDPVYPPEAQAAHVSGTVVLLATISEQGNVEALRVISGPTMLQQAALDAVKQWRYRPYLLNNTPVEVETTVNVVFNPPGATN
jgi:TonB family protein